MLSEVTGEACREYLRRRGRAGGTRRDLEDLRAAINHHAKEGLHRGVVRVVLPPKGRARERWLTRKEAAQLLRVCWRARETQTVHRGPLKNQKIETDKRPLRHLARFFLLGLYTGTRAGAIAAASPYKGEGRAYVDLERGIFYRLAEGQRETKKRQPPIPIPPRLLAHMRRWVAKGVVREHFVEWNGEPIKSVKTAFKKAVQLANLQGKISPHTLRHTAATWLMQAGVDKWEAAGFLGMSAEMLDHVYGHHHPDHLKAAARAIGYRPRQSLAYSLAEERDKRRGDAQRVENIGGPGRTRTCNQAVMSETRSPEDQVKSDDSDVTCRRLFTFSAGVSLANRWPGIPPSAKRSPRKFSRHVRVESVHPPITDMPRMGLACRLGAISGHSFARSVGPVGAS